MTVKPYFRHYRYDARFYDSNHNLVVLADDLESLQYQLQLGRVGMGIVTVTEGHRLLDALEDDLLMIVRIAMPASTGSVNVTWEDYLGLFRGRQRATDQYGIVHHLLYFPHVNDVLQRNIVAYRTSQGAKGTFPGLQIDAVMELISEYNCSTEATTDPDRFRAANPVRNLDVDAAGFVSLTLDDYTPAFRNVLEVLQELSALGNIDFDVQRKFGTESELILKFFDGELGIDRSESIIFQMGLHNLASVSLEDDRLREKTVAIVGGGGAGASRTITVRTGVNQAASNDYEVFVDASQADSTELPYIGDSKLAELEARTNLDASIVASQGYMYGRDYQVGDLVTAMLGDASAVKKVSGAEVRFSGDSVDIRLELIDA